MEEIKTLLVDWDFPDRKWMPDGYNMHQTPQATDENFHVLLEKVNELIQVVNKLMRQQSEKV